MTPFLPTYADPLKVNLTAISAVQRIPPCQYSVAPTEHDCIDTELLFDAVSDRCKHLNASL